MNCRETQKRIIDLLDTGFPEGDPELLRHLKNCPECSRRLEEARALLTGLRPRKKVTASPSFKERVMKKAIELEINEGQRKESGWQWMFRSRVIRAAAVLVLLAGVAVGIDLFAGRAGKAALSPFAVLAQAAEAIARTTTVHIKANMRTIPGDNFEIVMVDAEMIPVEMWREVGEKTRWRVEKSGRSVTMDGESTLMLMQAGDKGEGKPLAITGPANTGFVTWVKPIMEVESLFNREIERGNAENSTIAMEEATGADGRKKIVLGIEAAAKGDFSKSDYMKNKSVEESNNMRVYTFDAATKALEKLEVYVLIPDKKVLVFETTLVEYDKPVADDLLSTAPPEGVQPLSTADLMSAGAVAAGPKEAARMFFEAMSKGDQETLGKICPPLLAMMKSRPQMLEYLKDLEIVELGEAFQSGQYGGWFVPYQIRFSNGEVRKANLAVRNDQNPEKRWQMDGGF